MFASVLYANETRTLHSLLESIQRFSPLLSVDRDDGGSPITQRSLVTTVAQLSCGLNSPL